MPLVSFLELDLTCNQMSAFQLVPKIKRRGQHGETGTLLVGWCKALKIYHEDLAFLCCQKVDNAGAQEACSTHDSKEHTIRDLLQAKYASDGLLVKHEMNHILLSHISLGIYGIEAY